MKKTLRTFVAVEISRPIRARAGELIALLSGTTADVKWVEPHNLHLTLKFLGDVHERDIIEVCRAVEQGAAEKAPIVQFADRVGLWFLAGVTTAAAGVHWRECERRRAP